MISVVNLRRHTLNFPTKLIVGLPHAVRAYSQVNQMEQNLRRQ